MVKEISERKQSFRGKLERMLKEYQCALVVTVDNVGSSQLQKVRMSLRGKAEILLGKNTMTRMIIRAAAEKDKKLNALLNQIKGNCGLVFTNSDLSEIRKIILENKVPAAAKSGSAAPVDVKVPPGPTGLDPGQTSFFQALHIQTKIVKGAIEIINEVHLIKKGDKVGASEVSLLNKLNIKPFFYGIVVDTVYDHGSVYKADVLDLSEADLMNKFLAGVRKIAALTIRMGYPTAASLPHILTNAWTKLVAVTVGIEYSFKEVQKFKDYLANPEAFAAAAAVKSPSKSPKKSPGKGKAAAPKEEPKEESDDDAFGGGGLFGDDE